MDGLQKVIETYYNCIVEGKMTLEEVPEKYRKRVEIYWSEMERADS